MMRKKTVLLAAIAALTLSAFSAGCRKLEARDNLNKGVQAFKGAKYADAVEFFKTAIELDPEYPTARLYLATAYMSQYIPGAESPENLAFAKNALDNFELVLKDDPTNSTAVESIASLFYLQAQGTPKLEDKIERLGEAEKWYKRLTEVEPTRKEAWYSLGVIAWARWYPVWMEARTKAGMKPEAPGPLRDRKVREDLSDRYLGMINEGVKNLEKALELDNEYDDAMAYMNLLIRERADLADTQAAHDADIDSADNWMQKALETRKIKAERQPGASGISLE
ncbi:MAG: tetratricopeptide repeat protein [Bryobacteraceae bacterium]|nr:tetratricopeptide repeat protein [Bryobacteraceae bacterium]